MAQLMHYEKRTIPRLTFEEDNEKPKKMLIHEPIGVSNKISHFNQDRIVLDHTDRPDKPAVWVKPKKRRDRKAYEEEGEWSLFSAATAQLKKMLNPVRDSNGSTEAIAGIAGGITLLFGMRPNAISSPSFKALLKPYPHPCQQELEGKPSLQNHRGSLNILGDIELCVDIFYCLAKMLRWRALAIACMTCAYSIVLSHRAFLVYDFIAVLHFSFR
jgi:hypothetical protein